MPERNLAKQLEWLHGARAAYLETLQYVSRDDEQAARLIAQRVERSLAAIQTMPLLGTPTAAPGVRRYAIPNTGHVINYRIAGKHIIVQRWYRARRGS